MLPKKIFIASFVFALVFIPLLSFALDPLIQCGNPDQKPCTTCDVFQLVHRVIQFGFIYLLLPATAIAFLIGGVLMLTASGNETNITRARSILWNTLIGILIAFASWVIINTVISTIASGKINGKSWYEFPGCVEKSPVDKAINQAQIDQQLAEPITALNAPAEQASEALVFSIAAEWHAELVDSQAVSAVPVNLNLSSLWNAATVAFAETTRTLAAQEANHWADEAISSANQVLDDPASDSISTAIALEAKSRAQDAKRAEIGQSSYRFFAQNLAFKTAFAQSSFASPHMSLAVRSLSVATIARFYSQANFVGASSDDFVQELLNWGYTRVSDIIDLENKDEFNRSEYLNSLLMAAEAFLEMFPISESLSQTEETGVNQTAALLLAAGSCTCEMDRLNCDGSVQYHTSEVIDPGLCDARDGYTQDCKGKKKALWNAQCGSVTPPPPPAPSPSPSGSPPPPAPPPPAPSPSPSGSPPPPAPAPSPAPSPSGTPPPMPLLQSNTTTTNVNQAAENCCGAFCGDVLCPDASGRDPSASPFDPLDIGRDLGRTIVATDPNAPIGDLGLPGTTAPAPAPAHEQDLNDSEPAPEPTFPDPNVDPFGPFGPEAPAPAPGPAHEQDLDDSGAPAPAPAPGPGPEPDTDL